MPTDANAGRSIPLGGRQYPADAAGTIIPSGVVLSGDDAPLWRAAGYQTVDVHVQCSAKIAAGTDTVDTRHDYVIVAIDRNGADCATLTELTRAAADVGRGRLLAEQISPAEGVYAGTSTRSALANVAREDVAELHARLLDTLPGFGCFAILTLS